MRVQVNYRQEGAQGFLTQHESWQGMDMRLRMQELRWLISGHAGLNKMDVSPGACGGAGCGHMRGWGIAGHISIPRAAALLHLHMTAIILKAHNLGNTHSCMQGGLGMVVRRGR